MINRSICKKYLNCIVFLKKGAVEHLSNYKDIGTSLNMKSINCTTPVIYNYELFNVIMGKRENINLSIDQVKGIVDKLKANSINDKSIKKEHIYNVRNKIYEKIEKEKALICPRCNGNLIIRNGKYGNFYGCSNYPKCKYTHKI